MIKKTYTGINIQFPISELILNGTKTIETRTYPVPEKYLKQEMLLIETPGKNGNFKSRITAIIKFVDCFQYTSKTEFYLDSDRHCVTPNSMWAWKSGDKWGWKVVVVKKFKNKIPMVKRSGIKFTTGISI